MTITTTREKISFRCVFSCFFVYIHTSVSAYEVRDAMCLRSLFAFGNWIICTFSFCLFCLFFKTFLSFFFLRSGTTSATDPSRGEKSNNERSAHKRAKERGFVPPSIVVQKFFFLNNTERGRSTNGEVSVVESRESLLLLLFYPFLKIRHRSRSTHARTSGKERVTLSYGFIRTHSTKRSVAELLKHARALTRTRNTCSEVRRAGRREVFFCILTQRKREKKKGER